VVPQGLGEVGDVKPLIRLLSGQSEKLLQFVTGTLEIISSIPGNRVRIVENGGIEPLVKLLLHADPAIKTNVVGTMNNLCYMGIVEVVTLYLTVCLESARMDIIQRGGVTNLVELVDSTIEEDLQELGLALMVKLSQTSTRKSLTVWLGSVNQNKGGRGIN
jgi:hypothetical protein